MLKEKYGSRYDFNDMRIAYIAGFFDGEGWITAKKSTGGTFRLSIGIGNTERAPILFIKTMFGGNFYERRRPTGGKLFYEIEMSGLPAAEMLERLLPYLMIKRQLALLGIKLVGASRENRLVIHTEMKELNKKGEK